MEDPRAGRIAGYELDGPGPSVLLLHSINAAASTIEMRPVFDMLRGKRALTAVDLPGFGRSDRSDRRYEVRLYTDAVHAAADRASAQSGGEPVDAVALSLSCEFLARAVTERPERFRRIVLINPTGFSRGSDKLRVSGATREMRPFSFLFEGRPWSRPLFDLLTKEAVVRYFLRRTYGSRDVDEDLVKYDVLSARVLGAEHAPLAFLSGRLFSRDIRTVYEDLSLPVWVPHGTRGDFKDFSESSWAEARGHWRFEAFASGAMPHFEHPEPFSGSLNAFLEIE